MLLESKIRYILTNVNISYVLYKYVLEFYSLQFNGEFLSNKSECLVCSATFKHLLVYIMCVTSLI